MQQAKIGVLEKQVDTEFNLGVELKIRVIEKY